MAILLGVEHELCSDEDVMLLVRCNYTVSCGWELKFWFGNC